MFREPWIDRPDRGDEVGLAHGYLLLGPEKLSLSRQPARRRFPRRQSTDKSENENRLSVFGFQFSNSYDCP